MRSLALDTVYTHVYMTAGTSAVVYLFRKFLHRISLQLAVRKSDLQQYLASYRVAAWQDV